MLLLAAYFNTHLEDASTHKDRRLKAASTLSQILRLSFSGLLSLDAAVSIA
jgi:hypothetical protein